MSEDIQIDKVLHELKIVEKMFDCVRIVDPLKNKILAGGDDRIGDTAAACYAVWGKGKACENCISMRAFKENKTFVKIEYSPQKIFIVTVVPTVFNSRRVVVELLKDATDSLIFENEESLRNESAIFGLIENMNNIAMHDALTGIYNRHYINEKLPVDIIGAYLSNQSLSIIMADIDFFKKVNDDYGHLAGDHVLKACAGMLESKIKRGSDWLARYGGEEFLVCLPGAGPDKALEIAESMRKQIEDSEIVYSDNVIRVTCSFGVVTKVPAEDDTDESLMYNADKALYSAKEKGRNRVELFRW
jgi:diguanylate cyclase (GGDEF)-like protein